MDKQDRKHVDSYFSPFPKWAIVAVIVGALLALIGLSSSVGLVVAGLLALAAGGYGLYKVQQRPADSVIDNLRAEDIGHLKQRALDKTMIADEGPLRRDPVIVFAPRLRGLSGAKPGWRKGKDSYWRYTPINVTILNFSEHQLSAYQCTLDLRTGVPLQENTHEYYYKDVVSVQTNTSSGTLSASELDRETRARAMKARLIQNGFLSMRQSEQFSLTTSGGTSISMEIPSVELMKQLGGGDYGASQADDAVNAVRRMLREKKTPGTAL